MTSFACFNELSIQPLCVLETDAERRLRNFLVTLKEVRKHTNIKKVRHAGNMTTIQLTSNLTLQDYLNAHTKQTEVIALLGIFVQP